MSFVLNRDVKLEEKCDSPKLWRPGGVEGVETEQNQSVTSTKPPEPATGRTKEDLYKFYETMTPSSGPGDLSLKDLVERTQSRKVSHRSKLKKIQEDKAKDRRPPAALDKAGTFKWWNQNPNLSEGPNFPKVLVPSKANGDHVLDMPRKSFGEYLEEKYGDEASLQSRPGNKIPETSARGEHSRVSSAVTPGSRPAFVKPTPRNYHPSSSPLKSPLRSPLRSQSPLASPQHQERAVQLACASSPARLGGYERDNWEAIDWTNPAASPRHWGNTMFAPSPLAKEHYAREYARQQYRAHQQQEQQHQRSVSVDQTDRRGHKFILADELNMNNVSTAPSSAKTQPTNHCSSCSSYTLLKKIRCVACGKIFCRNCAKENMTKLPEGRKCKTTCQDEPPSSKDPSEEWSDKCWPFAFPKVAKKSESMSAKRGVSSQNNPQRVTKSNRTTPRRSVSSTNGNS